MFLQRKQQDGMKSFSSSRLVRTQASCDNVITGFHNTSGATFFLFYYKHESHASLTTKPNRII